VRVEKEEEVKCILFWTTSGTEGELEKRRMLCGFMMKKPLLASSPRCLRKKFDLCHWLAFSSDGFVLREQDCDMNLLYRDQHSVCKVEGYHSHDEFNNNPNMLCSVPFSCEVVLVLLP